MYYSNRLKCEALNERLVGPVSPMGAQIPAPRAGGDEALVFSVRELGQQMVDIVSEIEETGEPAFITKDGRFIATITPLVPGQVESQILPVMARQAVQRGWGGHAPVAAPAGWSPALFARL
jgi:antitoxin (DNA-binding transcriptional repressor) of toxin-antitoxin stability system